MDHRDGRHLRTAQSLEEKTAAGVLRSWRNLGGIDCGVDRRLVSTHLDAASVSDYIVFLFHLLNVKVAFFLQCSYYPAAFYIFSTNHRHVNFAEIKKK